METGTVQEKMDAVIAAFKEKGLEASFDQTPYEHRQLHYWYGGLVFSAALADGRSVELWANGDVRAEFGEGEDFVEVTDKNNDGRFMEEFCGVFETDSCVLTAIEDGTLQIDNNNWFEMFGREEDGTLVEFDWVSDSSLFFEAVDEIYGEIDKLDSWFPQAA